MMWIPIETLDKTKYQENIVFAGIYRDEFKGTHIERGNQFCLGVVDSNRIYTDFSPNVDITHYCILETLHL